MKESLDAAIAIAARDACESWWRDAPHNVGIFHNYMMRLEHLVAERGSPVSHDKDYERAY